MHRLLANCLVNVAIIVYMLLLLTILQMELGFTSKLISRKPQ